MPTPTPTPCINSHILNILSAVYAKSLQSRPTICNPMDCNPPGSSAHGVVQARILEWVAIPLPRIKLESPTFQANSLPSEPPENLMLSNPCSNEYLESGLVLGWKQAKSIVWK